MKFCSECGKPIWKSQKQYIKDLSVDNGEDEATLSGLPIRFPYWLNFNPQYAFVTVPECLVEASSWRSLNHNGVQLPLDLSNVRERLRAVLEPLQIWDAASFGLWSIARQR